MVYRSKYIAPNILYIFKQDKTHISYLFFIKGQNVPPTKNGGVLSKSMFKFLLTRLLGLPNNLYGLLLDISKFTFDKNQPLQTKN